MQLALPQMHSFVKSTQPRASFLQVGNLMPPLTTFIYLKLIARSGKLSVLCTEFMIMQILKMMDCVSVTAISKPEIEQEFSEQKQEHLKKLVQEDREKDLKLIHIWQLFRLLRSILDAVLSLFVDAGISPCPYFYPCWEQWLTHQVKYTPPALAHFQHCSQWGLIIGLQGVPMTEQSLTALYDNCFSTYMFLNLF